ncbi:hypothetical protein RM545_17170 [Zunongwangia sp. F260]|uniref:Lipoprotein n=1 Tax=Autumnicola lenta TaxID=3075593 RepID=A0ABU3CPZ1_9FLAO|nr:hypothetical protein [Zunongwangia sp. F260]MDT0648426.1 hypothetical protein [Zunongwangia sp. F260]
MKMNNLKKWVFILGASIVLTSCGNSIESDAKELAELTCKAEKDFTDLDNSQKLAELADELEGKYSGEDEEKFEKAFFEAKRNCK